MLKLKKKTLYDKKKSLKRMILCGTVLGMFTISAFSMGMSQGSNTLGKKAVGINETQKINKDNFKEFSLSYFIVFLLKYTLFLFQITIYLIYFIPCLFSNNTIHIYIIEFLLKC